MGVLAHYLEEEGLPTAGLSLVRLHSEKIRPPRALWVPYELGRPLGVPGDGAFQRRVLEAVLSLFEEGSGPVLKDYHEDVPEEANASEEGMACTVSFPPSDSDDGGTAEALLMEIGQLQQWHQLAVERAGRTTVGSSRLEMETIARFIGAVTDGEAVENPRPDLQRGETLKLACDDLRAFYTESVVIQPGQQHLTSEALSEWFWNGTAAGKAFWALRDVCIASEDEIMRTFGIYILVPRSQLKGTGGAEDWAAASAEDALKETLS